MNYLYRYERGLYDEFHPIIHLEKFPITRETAKGFWIIVFTEDVWVSSKARKRYAYPTKEEAFLNFQKRTKRCILILKSQLRRAEAFSTVKEPV